MNAPIRPSPHSFAAAHFPPFFPGGKRRLLVQAVRRIRMLHSAKPRLFDRRETAPFRPPTQADVSFRMGQPCGGPALRCSGGGGGGGWRRGRGGACVCVCVRARAFASRGCEDRGPIRGAWERGPLSLSPPRIGGAGERRGPLPRPSPIRGARERGRVMAGAGNDGELRKET